MNQILIGFDHNLSGVLQSANLQMFGINGLLKGEDARQHRFVDIKDGRVELHLPCLDFGNVKHRAHQTRQTLDLIRDQCQIMPLPLRRNGAVEDTVDKTGNTGHRCFQLVGDIGDKRPTHRLLLCQTVRHIIECH